MELPGEAWALMAVAVTGVASWFGRRFESAGTRAIASQGAAADEWQELAVFHRDRADRAEEKVRTLETEHDSFRQQIGGLENRLVQLGQPVRSADRT